MTPEQHILDALKTMEDRGVEPTMQDWEAIAELIAEGEQGSTDTAGSLPALPTNTLTIKR